MCNQIQLHSVLHIPIVHAHDVSKQIPREKTIFHRVENVIKQLVHMSAVCSSRYEVGSLESIQEARVPLGYALSNSYASFVLSKLPVCFIS